VALGHRERERTRGTLQPWRLPLDPSVSASPRGGGRACACTGGRKAGSPSRAAVAKPRGKVAEPAPSRAAEKASCTPIGPLQRLDDGSQVAAEDLVDWPDAPEELKARIIRLHRRLRQLSAWDLLGVEKDAANPTIKRAFGVASKELHPDRYFGKNLGSFRPSWPRSSTA